MTLSNVSIWILVAIFALGAVAGAWGMHTWQVTDLQKELAVLVAKLKAEQEKPPVVKETVTTKTETQLQYVPGETVYVKVPGDPAAPPQPTKLDGKFDIGKPTFTYTLNGKTGQFTKTDDERYVFDKNMLQLTQTSTINIQADIPTIDKTRRTSIMLDAQVDIKERRIHPGASAQRIYPSGFTVGTGATFDGSHARLGLGWSF